MDLTQGIQSGQKILKMLNCYSSYAGKREGDKKRKVDSF